MSDTHSDPARRLHAIVRAVWRETHPGRDIEIHDDSDFEHDLGFDSLGRMELLLRVGAAFGVELPDHGLEAARSPRTLLQLLAEAHPAMRHAIALAPPVAAREADGSPDGVTTLVEALEWHVARHGGRTHVLLYGDGVDSAEPRAITYADLLHDARRKAAGLLALGVRPQQAVALMLPTGQEYLACYFAALLVGAIPVPIYPPARIEQIEEHLRRHTRILDNARAAVIVTVREARPLAALLRRQVASLTDIVSSGDLDREPVPILYRGRAEDVAFIQYTSGSTGDPKGVALTHANLLANIRAMRDATQVTSADVFVSWLPLYHDMGLIGAWLGALYCAMPLVLMSPLAFLARPVRWLEAIHRHRGTLSAAPNFAFELVARKLPEEMLAGLDLSSWRIAFNGAEPVVAETLAAFTARLAPHGLGAGVVTPVYGLAECSVGLAFPPLSRGPRVDCVDREVFARERRAQPSDAADAMRVVACGRAIPGHQLRVADERGNTVPERQVGRVLFRGPSATSGYFRRPDATAQLIDADGWLDSGDYGYLADDEIFLTGRAKDVIIRGGRNLYPYELEQAAGALPGVRKGCVAVFAATDAAAGSERLVVVAETREADAAARDGLIHAIQSAALAAVGTPADDVVLAPPGSVLKTSSGKIRRAACREAYESGRLLAAPQPPWRRLAPLLLSSLGVRAVDALRGVLAWCYGLWAWIALGTALLLTLPILMLVARVRVVRVAAHWGARLARRLALLPLTIKGLERLPAKPHVLVINHASYLDALILTAVLPPTPGYAFVAKHALRHAPVGGRVLAHLGALFVDRADARHGIEQTAAMVERLGAGERIAVFPEGTFSRETGLRPFRMGAFAAAARAGVPVVVMGLSGTRHALRDRTWWPRRVRLTCVVGEVLVPTGQDWAAAVQLREAARTALQTLTGEPDLVG